MIQAVARAAQSQLTTDLKSVGKIEQPDQSPWSQAPREILSQVGEEIVGVPVVRVKKDGMNQ